AADDTLAKIAALGIKVRNGCAYHGIALNVHMDLSPFLGINPCGYEGLITVDLAGCGVHTTVSGAAQVLVGHLLDAFPAPDAR
ncbi:MAG TPA: octanoyltransferase, partial [Pusillimonas sp.]|nr:octanoyltransferase [Pusillimonas sp.]